MRTGIIRRSYTATNSSFQSRYGHGRSIARILTKKRVNETHARWTDFNRSHPIEGKAREQAWSGTVHGLIGELGVGTVTHSTLQMGLALAGLFAGLGATFIMLGGGLAWAGRAKKEVDIPDTVPESFTRNQESRVQV
jgi:hypothetical protein